MIRSITIIVTILLTVGIAEAAGARRRPTRAPLLLGPQCSRVAGTPAVTFSRDSGRTFATIDEPLTGIGYTYGLVALDTPGHLLAFHKQNLIRSTDYGCSWTVIEEFTDVPFPPYLAAAPGGIAYGWSDHRDFLISVQPDGEVRRLKSPVTEIAGLEPDRTNGQRLRLAGGDGSIWSSADGGLSFSRLGDLGLSSGLILYRVSFDPTNPDHLIAGTTIEGGFVSRDGGVSWARSTGLSSSGGPVNLFNIVVSPVDGNVVWAMGLDLRESDAGAPSRGRHLYRSGDGGSTFTPVVDDGNGVTLINGPLIVAHPVDRNLVSFVFGTYFAGYGTDLFTWDHGQNALSVAHHAYHGINAITFAPRQESIMYVGLEVVIRNQP